MLSYRQFEIKGVCILLMSFLLINMPRLHAQSGVSNIWVDSIAATPTSYVTKPPSDAFNDFESQETTDYTIRNGEGFNIQVDSFEVNGRTYDNFLVPDTVAIRRTDGSRFINIWYTLLVDPDTTLQIRLDPDAVENADLIYRTRNLNAGYDNILVNDDDQGQGAIQAQTERVDIIWRTGIVTCEPDSAVFPVFERGGNDEIKVAAITALDANGDPSAFTDLIQIDKTDWPGVGQTYDTYLILRSQNSQDDPIPLANIGTTVSLIPGPGTQSPQIVQGVAISFTELGISPNQIVYGYSLFASDVDPADPGVDLTDINTFPTTTLASVSGLDLIAGISAAVSADNCLTPSTGPGGYKAALATWLKANETEDVTTSTEGSPVTDWQDHWIGDNDFGTGTASPTYRNTSSQINFNPTVDFTTSTTSLTTPDNDDFNTSSSYTNKGINIAFRTNTGGSFNNRQVIYEQGDEDRGINIYMRNGDLHVTAWNRTSDGTGSPWNTGTNVTTRSTALAQNREYIVTLEVNGNSSITGSATAFLNGQSFGTIPNVGLLFNHAGGDIFLGGAGSGNGTQFDDTTSDTNVNSFNGEISEFIYCNEPGNFPLTQRRRIESYLAVKYGITLDQSTPINYLNAQGGIVYNTTLNASIGGYLEYNNDIAGIARDDRSEFSQQKSKSENDNSVVTMERGTEFPNDNTWLIWGNDAGANTDTELGDVPPLINQRLERVWRVAETGESGLVNITFDISELSFTGTPNVDDYSLLIAGNGSNGDFSSATVNTGATQSGTEITFSNVNLANGQYFTLGTGFIACAPGNVTNNLGLWLKANLGPSNTAEGGMVQTWADRAGSNNAAIGVATAPNYRASSINFNPSLDFDATTDRMNASAGFASRGYYMVVVPNENITGSQFQAPLGFGVPPAAGTSTLGGFYLGNAFGVNDRTGHVIGTGTNSYQRVEINAAKTYPQDEVQLFRVRDNVAGTATTIFQNGSVIGTNSFGTFRSVTNEEYALGNFEPSNSLGQNRPFNGRIAEIISYSSRPSDAENNRIESYLALKYGVTLNQSTARNYVNSSGTTIWDGTTANDLYDSDIAGIGRDDDSCLEQKQSKSVNDESIVTMGLETIAASNAANTNSFSANNSFLIWGDDAGQADQANVYTTLADLPGDITERMNRVWRVDETGTVGDVSISFDLTGLGYSTNSSDFQLIIGPNTLTPGTNDFSTATTISGGTFNGNVLTFNNVDFTDGEFFTLGTAIETCGPGGITSNIALWLKANEGTNTTTNGSTITSWSDFSGNSRNATGTDMGGGVPVPPTYVSEEFNFNPAIEFFDPSSTNAAYLQTAGTNDVDADMTMISVFRTGQVAGSTSDFQEAPSLIGAGVTAVNTDYGMGFSGGRLHVNAASNEGLNARSNNPPLYNNLQPYIFTATRLQSAASTAIQLYANSANVGEGASTNTLLSSPSRFAIGNQVDATVNAQLSARVAEVIVFSGVLSASERQRVESYLSIKYGMTRNVASLPAAEQDYLASDGTTITWDWSENTTYNNDIAGLARDDGQCFSQLKSKSENDDALVTMEVSSLNADNSYMLWANDDADIEDPNNREYNRSQVRSRLNREWRVQETGTVGTVTLTFDLEEITGPLGVGTNNLNEIRLMLDADGDFTSGVTLQAPNQIDAVNKTVSFEVDLSNDQFFTLGSREVAALPIELISFDAKSLENLVELDWITASEVNNAFYTIERSRSGKVFEPIGQLEGAGTSLEINRYQFKDLSPNEGINFYRIMQTDIGGMASYTEVKSVRFISKGQYRMMVQPNPVAAGNDLEVILEMPSGTQSYELSLIDMRGLTLNSLKGNSELKQLHIATEKLSRGLYLLRWRVDDQLSQTHKIIVR